MIDIVYDNLHPIQISLIIWECQYMEKCDLMKQLRI